MLIFDTTCHYSASVRDFGAKGDGCVDDGPAFQRALNSACSLIVIPEGRYSIGDTLRVPSNKTVLAHHRAIMRLADNAAHRSDDFLLTNNDQERGNRSIVVRGGIWDGNNENNVRGKDEDPNPYTGIAISFINVEDLTLADFTVRNPESFAIRIGEARHFTIENIDFHFSLMRPNQDGVHVGGFSEYGYIRNLRATTPNATNDDMVALNADDGVERALGRGQKLGPIRNIHIEGLSAESAYTFVRLLSSDQLIENIRIRDISGG